jgi:CheY-like chemotaxis protein
MKKKILWIEDDYYDIQGLTRPLEKEGFQIETALTAAEGAQKAAGWRDYDLIMVDLILPIPKDLEEVPEEVRAWNGEAYVGVGLVRWLFEKLQVDIPVVILSIVANPIPLYQLEEFQCLSYLPKRGLKPSEVKAEIYKILGVSDS